ncbi:MAG: PF20097 family protein [Clostridiaceae bacterium]|nr:PF20097 family protein [Clostridiaceae bacterium]
MKCPYCDEEMQLGYIQCRDGVIWDTKKRIVAALPSIRSSSIALGSGDGPFSGSSVLAYNCENCKKIVIDY